MFKQRNKSNRAKEATLRVLDFTAYRLSKNFTPNNYNGKKLYAFVCEICRQEKVGFILRYSLFARTAICR